MHPATPTNYFHPSALSDSQSVPLCLPLPPLHLHIWSLIQHSFKSETVLGKREGLDVFARVLGLALLPCVVRVSQ